MAQQQRNFTMKAIYALILDENTVDAAADYHIRANLEALSPSQKFLLEQAVEQEQVRKMMERADMTEQLNSLLNRFKANRS